MLSTMSPRAADPNQRTALIEAAARLISEHGIDALTLRRVAREVGTSTMAIYTHFGGMDELHQAVRREGFDRLAQHLGAVNETDDPVADLIHLGAAYFANAMENPHLYRAMFMGAPPPDPAARVGRETVDSLVGCMARCVEAGRLAKADPHDLASQMWAFTHGVVALQLAGMMSPEEARTTVLAGGANLLAAFGLTPATGARQAATSARRAGSGRPGSRPMERPDHS